MRRALLLLTLFSCAEGDPGSCRIDKIAHADLVNQSPTDCGSFSLQADGGFDDASMQAAQACVLDAIAHGHAFSLFYDQWDPYRHVRGGLTGSTAGMLKSYAYVGDSQGGSFDPRPIVTVQMCSSIVATGAASGSCIAGAGKPCLTCVGNSPAATVCRF